MSDDEILISLLGATNPYATYTHCDDSNSDQSMHFGVNVTFWRLHLQIHSSEDLKT